jgi:hypothetical protein
MKTVRRRKLRIISLAGEAGSVRRRIPVRLQLKCRQQFSFNDCTVIEI